jgi:hypothetical protein
MVRFIRILLALNPVIRSIGPAWTPTTWRSVLDITPPSRRDLDGDIPF